MNNYILKIDELSLTIGKKDILGKLTFEINTGEVYGLLGPNGSGKTSTLKCILGLVKPTSGKIFLFGEHLNKNRIEIFKKIGVMFETPSLYENLTAFENLKILQILYRLKEKEITSKLDLLALNDDKDVKVKYFSLGMKQRLCIAMALLHNPSLLILDEPFNGLDPIGIIRLRNTIYLLKQQGVTILVSSHLISEIEKVSDRFGILHQGKLLFHGAKTNVGFETKYLITISNNNQVIDQLQKLKIKILDNNSDYLSFETIGKEGLNTCLNRLHRIQCEVYSIENSHGSLEDFFINLINNQQV